MKKYYCIEKNCKNLISYNTFRYGKKLCASCAQKKRFKNPKNHPFYNKHHSKKSKEKIKNSDWHQNLNEKNNPRFIDGKSIIQHYCINCENKITWEAIRCGQCASRIRMLGKKGILSHNWKGGISTLGELIRQLDEYKIWKNKVRNPYICKKCGSKWLIEAHHLKPFAQILQEFLQYYNQFSIIEDKETLVRLSLSWSEFWDIDNGEALCNSCHNETKKFKNN